MKPFILTTVIFLSGCSMLFPREPGDELAHFSTQAPAIGDLLPDVAVVDSSGETVQLRSIVGDKPLLIRVGSHSCPVYRYRRFDMADLHEKYAGQVAFVTLYTLEAHPEGSISPYRDYEWNPWINKLTGVRVDQPDSLATRLQRATWSATELENPDRILTDTMTDAAWKSLGGAPSPAFVVDRAGRIVARQVWLDPGALDPILMNLVGAHNDR